MLVSCLVGGIYLQMDMGRANCETETRHHAHRNSQSGTFLLTVLREHLGLTAEWVSSSHSTLHASKIGGGISRANQKVADVVSVKPYQGLSAGGLRTKKYLLKRLARALRSGLLHLFLTFPTCMHGRSLEGISILNLIVALVDGDQKRTFHFFPRFPLRKRLFGKHFQAN